MNVQKLPDHILIHEENIAESIHWQGGQEIIDKELENRYLDIAEELEQYEEYKQFDDAILSLTH